MDYAPFDPLSATDDMLVTWCSTARFIHGGDRFVGVVRPASNVAIKIGGGVLEQEARNQAFAYEQLQDTRLRVPQVYRYFSNEKEGFRKGYIMMEYIPGSTMQECITANDTIEARDFYARQIHQAAIILSQISIPSSQPPGPVNGGEPYGYLFHAEESRVEFTSTQHMNSWMNERLQRAQDPSSKICKRTDLHELAGNGLLDFQDDDLVMIHGDLGPRNFIVKDDGTLVLLDWAYAGFYPREFEIFNCKIAETRDPVLSKVSELLIGTQQLESIVWKLYCIHVVNFLLYPEDLDSSLPVSSEPLVHSFLPKECMVEQHRRTPRRTRMAQPLENHD